MRICLIGNYYAGRPLDEGMAKTGWHLYQELKKRHDVIHLTVKRVFSREFWRAAKEFRPQIVHYIPGASTKSLLLTKILGYYCHARVIISVQQRNFCTYSACLLKPDLALVQSDATERMLIRSGYRTEFLPNGVDTEKFAPISNEMKKKLREKYGLNNNSFILLHIGPLRQWRNTITLSKLQEQGSQVVAVVSTTNPSEEDAIEELKCAGCIVWQRYFEDIEEVYALADLYIFPPMHRLGSIEVPLSVLEAMSCNLPVVTTKYGALPQMFTEEGGLHFIEQEADFVRLVAEVRANQEPVSTRKQVLAYSWENIARRLDQIYTRILEK